MILLKSVKKRSPFDRAGIKKGEYLVAFDGYPIEDELDFQFYSSQTNFTVTVKGKKGERTVDISKDENEDFGITYPEIELELRHCKNRCIFCFVEQCKKGMRETLYVKDDDYRLSFTCGSYITMSNLTQKDLDRIARLKLSPLYISVHCYDRETKRKICANPQSANLFDYIDYLSKFDIKFHTQIVMIDGINSGVVLKETVEELYKRFPHIQSVAVVPVGLTGHREGLYPLQIVSEETAKQTVEYIESFAQKVLHEKGTRFCWCSDEMYVLAKQSVPNLEYYEDLNQIENGVGEVSLFLESAKEKLRENLPLKGKYTCITGVAFGDILTEFAKELCEKNKDLDLDVKIIKNKWFGETVTVAGLLTATDIIEQTKDNLRYKNVILPSTVLKEFEDVFLDGITVKSFEKTLGCKTLISTGGESFVKILEGNYE